MESRRVFRGSITYSGPLTVVSLDYFGFKINLVTGNTLSYLRKLQGSLYYNAVAKEAWEKATFLMDFKE